MILVPVLSLAMQGIFNNTQPNQQRRIAKAWVDMMVSDHQKAVAMFENAEKNASTDQAKALASAALPTLRDHLKAVQDLQTKMGAM